MFWSGMGSLSQKALTVRSAQSSNCQNGHLDGRLEYKRIHQMRTRDGYAMMKIRLLPKRLTFACFHFVGSSFEVIIGSSNIVCLNGDDATRLSQSFFSTCQEAARNRSVVGKEDESVYMPIMPHFVELKFECNKHFTDGSDMSFTLLG